MGSKHFYQLSHLCSPKQMMMVSLPCGALWVYAPGVGWGRVGGVACPSVWLRGGFPCRVSPLLSAGAHLLSTLCRRGFLPIPLLIGLCFCHGKAKRCGNMSALKSLQPPLPPKQLKNMDLSALDCCCATQAKGLSEFLLLPL